MKIERYFEDPSRLHIGCEENRAYYIPFSEENAALGGRREDSDRFISLNGQWLFRYTKSIYDTEDFIGGNSEGFSLIPVPSCWQMLGFDYHQYTNTRYPFPCDPPFVPHENPCGSYIRNFELEVKEDEKYYLNFEGVDSCFYVWINGQFTGYSQVSHSTSEFDITKHVRNGENRLCVLVLKWCDGSYLEDQDKLRMSGIFRDVYILKRPKKHIRDFMINTDHLGNVRIQYEGDTDAAFKLLDKSNVIYEAKGEKGDIQFRISDPVLWNAENPYLYTLIIKAGKEYIVQRIGFRKIEIQNGIVLLNGERVRFKGVNRHDSDPKTGYTVGYEQIMKDLRLMKEHNINAIRASHYPNAPYFTELCDELGFYVIDEADIEIHGVAAIYMGSQDTTFGLLAQDERFHDAILDRVQRCVIRDKNRTSVLLWSLGNEGGFGENFEDAGRWVKKYDPSRLTHYESSVHETGGHKNDTSMLDVYSTMYATPEWIREYFSDKKNKKPYMQCEYIHAMGNGPGGMEEYISLMDENPGFFGAFVWEWCDHAIYRGHKDGRDIYFYGGDFGELLHDSNFCMDGLVYPDRRPHTGLIDYKNAIRPARAYREGNDIELENRLNFTDLKDEINIRYRLLFNGEEILAGTIDTPSVKPWKRERIDLPDFDLSGGGEYFINLEYYQKNDKPCTKAGHFLGFDQIILRESDKTPYYAEPLREDGKDALYSPIKTEESEKFIDISGEGFSYRFNKLKGIFEEIKFGKTSVTEKPLEWNIWRAPTDNDRNVRVRWQDAGYDRITVRASGVACENDGEVKIRCEAVISAVCIQRILTLKVLWTIRKDGEIILWVNARKNKELPYLPRFGVRAFVSKEFDAVSYYGCGPYESYTDKRCASYIGRFTEKVENLHEDYIKPQENGSHCGCREVSLISDSLKWTVIGEDFSFNASEYSQEELTGKAHNFELEKCKRNVFCIDYKQSGIGSNSCGPEPAEEYKLNDDFVFKSIWKFTKG